jgi:hypothetical protein
MGWYLKYGAIGFVFISSLLWAAENLSFMKSASARATKACAGKTGFFDGPNSYYWCLRRVEAGGKP